MAVGESLAEKFKDPRNVSLREVVCAHLSMLIPRAVVSQLAELFWNLEYCEKAAVTPTIDLAKLALVTSQDEEEEDQDKTGTDTSNDTDATLVDDGPAPSRTHDRSKSSSPIVASPTTESSSVLGKRARADPAVMDVDMEGGVEKGKENFVLVGKAEASGSKGKDTGDIEMVEDIAKPQAPPLPPRKPREVDDSVMMFGKHFQSPPGSDFREAFTDRIAGRQHDVSECMDNCMFQIETALLDFHDMTDSEDAKTSVVKR